MTLGILLLQNALRLLLSTRSLLFFTGYPTTLEPLPGSVTKVRVTVPSTLRWKPGDHAFLRIPALSLLDNHPFTIASAPPASSTPTTTPNTLSFLIRTHAGFTSRLAALAATNPHHHTSPSSPSTSSLESQTIPPPATPVTPPLRTLIDGPHSHASAPTIPLHAIDTVVLVAGGTGVTAALPWLGCLSRAMAADTTSSTPDAHSACRVRVVRLVWVVRGVECLEWIRGEVEEAVGSGGGRVVVDVYVTRGVGSGGEVEVVEGMPARPLPVMKAGGGGRRGGDGDGIGEGGLATVVGVEKLERSGLNLHFERPRIAELLPTLMRGERAFVLACGPEGLKIELSNAVARLQMEMVVRSRRMRSIALHTETFGW